MKFNKIIIALLLAAVTACGRSSGSKQQIISKGVEDLLLPEEIVAPEEMAPAPEEKTPAQARPHHLLLPLQPELRRRRPVRGRYSV